MHDRLRSPLSARWAAYWTRRNTIRVTGFVAIEGAALVTAWHHWPYLMHP